MEPVARDKESMIPILCQSKFLLSWLVNEPPPNVPPPINEGLIRPYYGKNQWLAKGLFQHLTPQKREDLLLLKRDCLKKNTDFKQSYS